MFDRGCTQEDTQLEAAVTALRRREQEDSARRAEAAEAAAASVASAEMRAAKVRREM